MSNAPDIPRITNTTNVNIPKNPNGLTNLAGNENLTAVKTVRSNPSQIQYRNDTNPVRLLNETAIPNYTIIINSPLWR